MNVRGELILSGLLVLGVGISATCERASAVEISCSKDDVKTEVEAEDRDPDFEDLISVETITIDVKGNKATLKLADSKGKAITLPVALGEDKFKQESSIELKKKVATSRVKKGKKAKKGKAAPQEVFVNDAVSVVDDSYGSHFYLYVDEAALKAHKKNSVKARIWTASVGEPDDDTGHSNLVDNTSIKFVCE